MTYSESFFEVTAQIIPVLFLALVLESRLQPGKSATAGERVTHSWVLALLVIGEIITLCVVAGGLQPSIGIGRLVAGTMLFPAFLIPLPVIMRARKKMSARERWGHATASLAIIVTVLITILAVFLQSR